MRVRAAVLERAGTAPEIRSLELEPPRGDEIVVRMRACGICHTDLAVADAGAPVQLPAVLGHEGTGIVIAAGDRVTGPLPGESVVVSFGSCGVCGPCLRGRPAYCRQAARLNFSGRRGDGSTALRDDAGGEVSGHFFSQSSFSTHAVVPARSAVAVPAELPSELLAPLGCSVQTGVGTILGALAAEAGEAVAIFGAGAVGLSAVMGALIAGCGPILVVEPRGDRRALALSLGADAAFDPRGADPVAAIRGRTNGGAEISVDTVSTPSVLRAAIESLRTPGRCATLGLTLGPNEVTLDQRHLLFGRSVQGVLEGDSEPRQLIPELAAHLRAGRLPLEQLVTTFPFDQLPEALRAARAGTVVKPVLSFENNADE